MKTKLCITLQSKELEIINHLTVPQLLRIQPPFGWEPTYSCVIIIIIIYHIDCWDVFQINDHWL